MCQCDALKEAEVYLLLLKPVVSVLFFVGWVNLSEIGCSWRSQNVSKSRANFTETKRKITQPPL